MRPPFRSTQAVIINAPLEAVWAFSMDITKIPEFTPASSKWSYSQGKLSANRAFRTSAASQVGNTRVLRRTSKFCPCRRLSLYCRRIRSE